MIVLATDFGLEGPYVGQVQAVLYNNAHGVAVVNLFADLPAFRPQASAYLIAAYAQAFEPGTVYLGVVDPGVGSARRGLVVNADGRWFVGPDNGLFDVVCKRAKNVRRWEITYRPERLSVSFHGRDIFAPVAAMIARGEAVPGREVYDGPEAWEHWPEDLFQVVYIDRYGNALTGVRAQALDANAELVLKSQHIRYARTFAAAAPAVPFWYENANGLAEFALKEDSVSRVLGLAVGNSFQLAV